MSQEGRYLRRMIADLAAGTTVLINADRDVNFVAEGTNLGNPSMSLAAFITAAMYDTDPPVVNSFTGGSNLEKGESTLGYDLDFNVSAPAGGTIASIVITRSDGGASSGDIKVGTASQSGTHAITLTANTNCIFTITVTSNDGKTATSTTTFAFYNRIFWGVETDPGTYDDVFIKALSNNPFDANYSTAFTLTPGALEYIYFAVPKAYVVSPYLEPPYFYVGGFAGGFEIADETVSYTFEGNTEDYIIYKSVNPNLGNTSVTVQST